MDQLGYVGFNESDNGAKAMTNLKKILIYSALALLTPVPVFAQGEAKSEFSAGYDFLRLMGDSDQNLPSGWYGEIAWNATPMLATVGQITGHYQNLSGAGLHTFGGGVRLSDPQSKAALFAHVLVGVALLSSSSAAVLPPNHVGPAPLGLRESGGSPFLQVGAGVNLMRNAPIGVRVGGDFVRAGDEIGNLVRLAVGVVVPFDR